MVQFSAGHFARFRKVWDDMKEYSFFIPGVLPGMNEILDAAGRRKGRFSMYNEMKKEVEERIQLAAIRCPKFTKPIVTIIWFEKNRRRDPDNIVAGRKFVMDGLVSSGKIPGDGWRNVAGFRDEFMISKENPGVKVILMEDEIL